MDKQHSIVFFGTGPVALASLKYLAARFDVEAVITKPDIKITSRKQQSESVNAWAKKHGLAVFNTNSKADLLDLFGKSNLKSPVGIVVDYGILIPKAVIDYFPKGIVNSHFSLLPQWRGADPITFAILSGQKVTGVSLMLIVPKLDEGDLIAQQRLSIPADATTKSLTNDLINLSNRLLSDSLPLYTPGKIVPFAQNSDIKPSYSRKITKADGQIDWREPAEVIEREIRAYVGWPGSFSYLDGKLIKILETEVVEYNSKTPGFICNVNGNLHVECGQNSLLVNKLQLAGKNPVSGSEFLRGYPHYAGKKFTSGM